MAKIWIEDVVIPTYEIGPSEKNPIFLEKRVYQGSSGVVYPYPVIEKIEDEAKDKTYRAVFLENEYLKVMILPELGGRVQMAYDKIKERHFIYYNHVIKPALVGLTGPWISGGIEFNWPQHHRPSTYLPIDFTIEKEDDGTVTVWVNEQERMFHQKGMAGFTLRPGCARLEIRGKLYNPTPVPQTFLWWANPAVAVNDYYQSVFPADVHAVFDHGKRDVSTYPIATGVYYKMDYSAGVDISRYKNIPVPTSYMAIQSRYDFVGGYENDSRGGVLHVADHHVSPGKKQWTWGNGDFGQAWDRNLTDSDGPYIELMAGVFTDNQPDFTWLQPYEQKTFTQYFIPYRELGVVKNASRDLIMNLEETAGGVVLKLLAVRKLDNVRIVVSKAGRTLFETERTLTVEEVFEQIVALDGLDETCMAAVYDQSGRVLLSWSPEPKGTKPTPEPAKAALDPQDVASTEQLYLTGLHLEQYRHATYRPEDYYLEALRRDPSDVRNNNAMGLLLIRKGQFVKAEPYLRQAIATLTERNPNPYDGEPYYNLGVALKFQGRNEEAYDAFYKACWNAAWQGPGYYALAQLSVAAGNWDRALDEVDNALLRNWHNHRARHLKTIILRNLGREAEARALIEESLKIDPFNYGVSFESCLMSGDVAARKALQQLMREDNHNYEELILDYAGAGCWSEMVAVADFAEEGVRSPSPMLYYYKAWALASLGRHTESLETIKKAEVLPADPFFPNRLEAIIALEYASRAYDKASKALYLLGDIWYDKRQYPEAIAAWEKSIEIDDTYPTVLRNLALASFNKLHDAGRAVELLEKAFALDQTDGRILMELDQLYKRINRSHEFRLAHLDQNKKVAFGRDDLYLEYATLLNQLGRYEEAIAMIDSRKFHPWEGGEGKVPAQYQLARVELVKQLLAKHDYAKALEWIEQCFVYPPNLGEGKLQGAQENDFNYFKGCALEGLGRQDEAKQCFLAASKGLSEPAAAMYYNDQKPDKIFYQGLALLKLGETAQAQERFDRLIGYGQEHLDDIFKMDYFAVSLPDLQIWEDDMTRRNRIHCLYLMGLGHMGRGEHDAAARYFNEAACLDNNHQGVQIHQIMNNNR